jgi:hypothetical protein
LTFADAPDRTLDADGVLHAHFMQWDLVPFWTGADIDECRQLRLAVAAGFVDLVAHAVREILKPPPGFWWQLILMPA